MGKREDAIVNFGAWGEGNVGRERKAFFDYSRLKTIFPSSPLGGGGEDDA